MANKRISKEITNKEDIEFLLNITEDECLKQSFIMETFGEFDGKSRFHPYDTIKIPANSYGPENKRNKNAFTTTVGIWVFNKAFIEKDLFDIFGYVNKTITKKEYGKMNDTLSYALLEDKIDIETLKRFVMKCQKFMPYVSVLSPSHTLEMLTCSKKINKKKEELLKKYAKEIEAGDAKVVDQIEKELLDYAMELLGDDPSMDMYLSGANGSLGNNFKNMYVMKGATKDPDPTKGYNIITSSYADGVKKEEYAMLANALAEGPYARSRKTQLGGYWEKLFLAAFQHVILDEPGSDCGTTRYIEIDVTSSNIKEIMYCYAIEGSRLVEITSDNRDRFIGKKVKLRFASMCESKTGICNKCAGNLFYRLGIRNIGTATPQIPSKLKNIAMKSFHDSTQKFVDIDVNKAFGF